MPGSGQPPRARHDRRPRRDPGRLRGAGGRLDGLLRRGGEVAWLAGGTPGPLLLRRVPPGAPMVRAGTGRQLRGAGRSLPELPIPDRSRGTLGGARRGRDRGRTRPGRARAGGTADRLTLRGGTLPGQGREPAWFRAGLAWVRPGAGRGQAPKRPVSSRTDRKSVV